jgi:uncharacterized membrane protein YdfJ with MMPL/SSD domain
MPAPESGTPNLAARAAGWSAQHRRRAILGWLAFILVAYVVGTAIGQRHLTNAEMGNGASGTATQIISDAFPKQANEQVLVQVAGGQRIGNATSMATLRDLVSRLRAARYVGNVRSPLTAAGRGQISHDGRSALVTFTLAGDEAQAPQRVVVPLGVVTATQRAHPSVRVEEFGEASAARALNQSFSNDFRQAEYTSLPVTLIILLFAFGSLVAAGIPLFLGLTAVIGALGLLGPLSHLVAVPEGTVDSVVLLIGLAVGVDYSMFYLRRKLEERHAGHDNASALARAAATSGRAVLVSGMTVMAAMAGMFLAGNSVFTSFGMATVLVVFAALIGSLTVLPAVISRLGDNIGRGRAPIIARRRARGESRFWGYIVDHVLRVPAVSCALATLLLLALALPALNMHTVSPGTVGLPRNLAIMQTYDRIEAAFPGSPIPAVVVVRAPNVRTPAVRRGIAAMARSALATPTMRGPVLISVSPDRTVETVTLSLAGNGTDRRSEAALASLRTHIIPATVGRVPDVRTYVAGTTAQSKDFNDTMKAHLPFVFAFVLGLAFVLLLVTFRSLVIPVTTIALNLLSVGAAYGAITLIFQDGYLRSALGATNIGGVIDWLPLFLFVILFGLSMDYHVLILGRIREEHLRGHPTTEAVRIGIKATAGVVTSAAIVMVAVFSIFATLSAVVFKQLGVGLAIAVLIDATIVRAVLLPSVMTMLGERNWYLPRRWRLMPPAAGGGRRDTLGHDRPPSPRTARGPLARAPRRDHRRLAPPRSRR